MGTVLWTIVFKLIQIYKTTQIINIIQKHSFVFDFHLKRYSGHIDFSSYWQKLKQTQIRKFENRLPAINDYGECMN